MCACLLWHLFRTTLSADRAIVTEDPASRRRTNFFFFFFPFFFSISFFFFLLSRFDPLPTASAKVIFYLLLADIQL